VAKKGGSTKKKTKKEGDDGAVISFNEVRRI
jgi:hypothetical protein